MELLKILRTIDSKKIELIGDDIEFEMGEDFFDS